MIYYHHRITKFTKCFIRIFEISLPPSEKDWGGGRVGRRPGVQTRPRPLRQIYLCMFVREKAQSPWGDRRGDAEQREVGPAREPGAAAPARSERACGSGRRISTFWHRSE